MSKDDVIILLLLIILNNVQPENFVFFVLAFCYAIAFVLDCLIETVRFLKVWLRYRKRRFCKT